MSGTPQIAVQIHTKDLDGEVADELTDRAIDMEYLADGGEIVITADAQSAKWVQISERETTGMMETVVMMMEEMIKKVVDK